MVGSSFILCPYTYILWVNSYIKKRLCGDVVFFLASLARYKPDNFPIFQQGEHGNMIIVGIHAYNKWELSLLISDDKFESNKLMDGGRKILNSAVDINIDQVQEKANSSLKEKAIKDIEQKGFIVKDNNLFQSLGGDPRILSDSEFEMVYGEPRD